MNGSGRSVLRWPETDGRPTSRIIGEIQRPDERRHGFSRAAAGEYGPEVQALRSTFVAKYPNGAALSWSVNNVLKGGEDGPVSPHRIVVKDLERATRHIKDLARFYRADAVGVCELPPFAVYSHGAETGQPIELNHKYAIAVLVDQDYRTMRGSTGMDMISAAQSFISYSHSGLIAIQIAQYLRQLGYPARAHFPRVYQVALTPILLYAGLGEMS
ncbi:MAG: reductive dehalogenase, partial [Dehalococcoidia bacterium]|nr:reductive dehalogenase [Dehalococcoidia bacterium]